MNLPHARACVMANNSAVDMFVGGDFRAAAADFERALESLARVLQPDFSPAPNLTQNLLPAPSLNVKKYMWSQGTETDLEADDVFIHSKAVYLISSPADVLDPALLRVYTAFILYNNAICHHMMAVASAHNAFALREDCIGKAILFYEMSFGTMQESAHRDFALLAVLFNNRGHICCQQSMTLEATECFKLVHAIMPVLSRDSFETYDYQGLYFNSFINLSTARAA